MTATISVIIPAYNAQSFLAASIESVLAQTLTAEEIIVVDDGSTDGTAVVAKSFGDQITFLQQANQGTGPARNLGLQQCQGDLIVLHDADDIMTPDRLEAQANFIEQHPEFDIVFGKQLQFDDGEQPHELNEANLQNAKVAPIPGTMICRRDVYDRVGPYLADHDVGECVEWLARATDQGMKIGSMDHLVLHRRRHAGNQSRANRESFVHVVKGILDRRRAQ